MGKGEMKQEDQKKRNKKKVAALLTVLALLAMIVGTFAWKSYTDWVKNHMQTAGFEKGKVTIIDTMPNPEITPGGTISKDVSVVNSSNAPALVRVSFEEMLHKLKPAALDAKGYESEDKAGFPVVFDAKEYVSANGWEDQTARLSVDGVLVNGAAPYENLKLFVKGGSAALYVAKPMAKADYPKETVFDGGKGENQGKYPKIPVLSGSWEQDNAVVATKVTGQITRDAANNTWDIKTTGDEDKALRFWGYGVGLDDAAIEKNWAGKAVFVGKESDAHQLDTNVAENNTKALADGRIILDTPAIATGLNDQSLDKWFYNEKDGYFYYLGMLPAGATTANSLLKSVKIPNAPDYNIASYDLYVGMEAIPAGKAAMTAASTNGLIGDKTNPTKPTLDINNKVSEVNGSGWGLDPSDPADKALIDFFVAKKFLPLDLKEEDANK